MPVLVMLLCVERCDEVTSFSTRKVTSLCLLTYLGTELVHKKMHDDYSAAQGPAQSRFLALVPAKS